MPPIKRKNNTITIRITDKTLNQLEKLQETIKPNYHNYYTGYTTKTEIIEKSIEIMYKIIIKNEEKTTKDLIVRQITEE